MSIIWADRLPHIYHQIYNTDPHACAYILNCNMNLIVKYDGLPLINLILLAALTYKKKDYRTLVKLLKKRYWKLDMKTDIVTLSVLHIKKKTRVLRINDISMENRISIKDMDCLQLYDLLVRTAHTLPTIINTLDGKPLIRKQLLSKYASDSIKNLHLFNKYIFAPSIMNTMCKNVAHINMGTELILCIICYDALRNCIFDPCKHVICCDNCSMNVTKCPICTTQINKYEIVYL
jgi:hypothetical protein